MPEETEKPRCDTGAMHFPSDKITLGSLRQGEPHYFTMRALESGAISDCDGFAIVRREVRLAEKAFAKALGHPDPYPDETHHRDALIEDLDEAYREYGLSTGKRASLELIRQIEAAAVAQALRYGGRRR